jgi:acyl carrier protein
MENLITKKQIFKLIEQSLNLASGSITEESKYSDFKQWDSLGCLIIMLALQNNFSLVKVIPDDKIFFSVKEIFEFYGV